MIKPIPSGVSLSKPFQASPKQPKSDAFSIRFGSTGTNVPTDPIVRDIVETARTAFPNTFLGRFFANLNGYPGKFFKSVAGRDLDRMDTSGLTAMHILEVEGNSKAVSVLRLAGANPDLSPQLLFRPRISDDETVQSVYDWARFPDGAAPSLASINAQDERRNSALHYVAMAANIDAIQRLIDLGADRTLKNKVGQVPSDLFSHSPSYIPSLFEK